MHQADLIDMQQYADSNGGVRFLLLVEDTFSKFIWVQPLLDKKAKSVLNAFQLIYHKYSDFPVELSTDKGKEFHNKDLKAFFHGNDVDFFSSDGNTKAQFAERTIQSFNTLILKYMRLHDTKTYVIILPDLVTAYNNTYKRSIKMKPSQVSPQNMKQVFLNLYHKSIPHLIMEELVASKISLRHNSLQSRNFV